MFAVALLPLLLAACALPTAGPGSRDADVAVSRRVAEAAPAERVPLPAEPQLGDYVKYAALHNPGLRAAFEQWRAAVERVPQVTALPDPMLSYAYYIEQVETRVGPQRHRLGVKQAFPWFGKLRLRGDVASAHARAAAQQLEALRLKVAHGVKDAYYELYYLARAIAITKENTALLKYVESVARSRYRVRRGEYADVLRTQVEFGKLEDRLRSLEDLRRPIAARLNAALSRPSDAPVPWPKAIALETLADDGQVLAWMREANPELKALEAEIERQATAVELAHKDRYPDFALGLTYIETGTAGLPGTGGGNDPLIAELSVTVPLWRSKYEAAEREARARLRGAKASLADRRNALDAAIQLALFKLRDADRKSGLYRDNLVPKARQGLKATETAYTAGKASLTDVIDAERVLLDFRLAQERALADHAQRLAELEMLVGRALPLRPQRAPKPRREGEAPAEPRAGEGPRDREPSAGDGRRLGGSLALPGAERAGGTKPTEDGPKNEEKE